MNWGNIVYTAADYKIGIKFGDITVPLNIVEEVGYGSKVESEYVHVIGSKEPQALKTNAATYPGKLTIEAGELELLLAANGEVFATQVTDAVISIIALSGAFAKIIFGVSFTAHDATIKAKDKRSLISLSFESLGAKGL